MSVISGTNIYPRAEHKLDDDSWPNPHIQLPSKYPDRAIQQPSKYPDRAVPELEINPLVEHHHISRRPQPTEFDFSESDEYKDRTYHHRQQRMVAFERENVAKRPRKKTREAPKVESEVLTIKHTPVGALFTLLVASPINVIDPENFPTWLRFNQSSGEIRTRIGFEVYGIAQPADIGVHSLKVGNKRIEIHVTEGELHEQCTNNAHSILVEVPGKFVLKNISPPEQVQTLKNLHSVLVKNGINEVRLIDWRLFTGRWLDRYRMVHKRIAGIMPHPAEEAFFVLHLACNELNEFATDVISAIAEDGRDFEIVEGVLSVQPLGLPRPTTPSSPIDATDRSKSSTAFIDIPSIAPWIAALLVVIVLASLVIYWFVLRDGKTASNIRKSVKLINR